MQVFSKYLTPVTQVFAKYLTIDPREQVKYLTVDHESRYVLNTRCSIRESRYLLNQYPMFTKYRLLPMVLLLLLRTRNNSGQPTRNISRYRFVLSSIIIMIAEIFVVDLILWVHAPTAK